MGRLFVSPFRGSRSPATRVAAILFTIKIAPGLFVTAAAGETLSAPAERYATCVEREAVTSAKAHIQDREVVGSAVPKEALLIIVNKDLVRTCGPLFAEASNPVTVDLVRALDRGFYATKAAITAALIDSPPPHQVVPGNDDYEHGEKLNTGAFYYLSIECQALFDSSKGTAPSSCNQEVRKANRLVKEDSDHKFNEMLEMPSVRYCLGLRSIGDVESRQPKISNGDPFADLDPDEDYRKLQAALADPSNKLTNCVDRIRAAGGLVFIDPKHEMARVNRVPEVKQASDQYAKCTTDRAVEFARVSNESAETIARAALGGCSALREQYLASLARGLGIVMTPEIAAQEEKEVTGALIGQVIVARATKAGRVGDGTSGE